MFCFLLNWRKNSNYFKIAVWQSDSMKRNFMGFTFNALLFLQIGCKIPNFFFKKCKFLESFFKELFVKQVSKILSNLTKWLCTSWKLGASYIVINRKLFNFFAVPKMKLLVEFSIVQPSIRMARLATFLKVGLVWRKFTFAIFTVISLGFLAK